MSANTHDTHAPDAHASHGHHDEAAPHGSFKSYMIGFGLSVVLTAIPFWLVMSGVLDSTLATAIAIMAFAAVQIVVHMIFFLHTNARSENGWTLMALIFTVILVVIAISGSLRVMYNMNANMMPAGMTMTGGGM